MNPKVTLCQEDLIFEYKAKIPNQLKYHVALAEIKSSTELTDKKIKEVVKIMIESAIYTHLGFSGSTNRKEKLMNSFEQLKRENIEFTVYADTRSGAKNIHFPSCFSF